MTTTFKSVVNNGQATLAASIGPTDLEVTLATGEGANLPSSNFYFKLNNELMLIQSRSTDTLTINSTGERGVQGTSAGSHDAGDVGKVTWTKSHIEDVHNAINALENKFPVSTDNALARFDSTVGKLQNSGVIVDDSNNVSGIGTILTSHFNTDANTVNFINALGRVYFYNTTEYGSSPNSFFRFWLKDSSGANADFGSLWVVPTSYTAGAHTATWKLGLPNGAGGYEYDRFTLDHLGNGKVEGDWQVNGGDMDSIATTFNLLSTPTTINFGDGASVAMTIGHASGTITLKGKQAVGSASTDTCTMTGRLIHRQVNDAGPMTATAGTAGEVVFNTANSTFYGCTVTGSPATWVALH